MRGRMPGRDPLEQLRAGESDDTPVYHIGVAAALVGLHAQTLRHYERAGLIEPARSAGGIRMYSPRDIERLTAINWLSNELGINLAGVEIIFELRRQMDELEQELRLIRSEVTAARGLFLEDRGRAGDEAEGRRSA